jgi:hypothetical protein
MRNTILVVLLLLQAIITSAQSSTAFIIPYRDGARWGFCDTLGRVLIKPQFDSASFFIMPTGDKDATVGTIYVKNKMGLIGPSGKIIVPPQFEEIHYYGSSYAAVRNRKMGLYSAKGQLLLPVQYDMIEGAGYFSNIFKLQLNNKWGLYHPELKKTLPPTYDLITSDFYSEVTDHRKYFFARKGKQKFLIAKATLAVVHYKGEEDLEDMGDAIAMPPEVSEMMPIADAEEADIRALKAHFGTDSVWRYHNQQHQYALNKRVYQYRKGGKYGLAYGNLGTLMQPLYDSVTYVMSLPYNNHYLPKKSHDLLAVRKGDAYGLITSIPSFYNGFEIRKGDKVGVFLPNTFYPAIQPKYDSVELATALRVTEGWSFLIFKVIKNGRTGYVGENGVEYFQ